MLWPLSHFATGSKLDIFIESPSHKQKFDASTWTAARSCKGFASKAKEVHLQASDFQDLIWPPRDELETDDEELTTSLVRHLRHHAFDPDEYCSRIRMPPSKDLLFRTRYALERAFESYALTDAAYEDGLRHAIIRMGRCLKEIIWGRGRRRAGKDWMRDRAEANGQEGLARWRKLKKVSSEIESWAVENAVVKERRNQGVVKATIGFGLA